MATKSASWSWCGEDDHDLEIKAGMSAVTAGGHGRDMFVDKSGRM